MQKIIVMLGAPGAGKGTQSRRLSERFGYPQISTGDILREMAKAPTALGQEIKTVQSAGQLVSDDVLAKVIRTRTAQPDSSNGYILDGFPRTLDQAKLLDQLASEQDKDIILVRVVTSHDALMKRLTGRRTCATCGEIYNIYSRPPKVDLICDRDGGPALQRDDDNAESVEARLKAYEESTAPLIDHYRKSGRMIEIDGERPVDKVFETILSVVSGQGSGVSKKTGQNSPTPDP